MNKNINFSKITWTTEKPKNFDLVNEYQNQVDSIIDKKLISKKDIDFLSSYIDGEENLEKVIEKYGAQKLIDLVFDEDIYRKITNYDGKLYRSKYTRYNGNKKTKFNELVSYLIKEKEDYYFEKLFSLEQNSFRKIVQKTHQTSILYAIYNFNIDENLKKQFANKLLKNIDFYQLKDNRGDSIKKDNSKDNYYSLIQKFNPETFEKVNVKRLLTDNISFIQSDSFDDDFNISDFFNKNNILDEILNLENGLELLLNTKNPKFFKEIFINEDFIDLILKQDEKIILKYIFLLKNNHFILEDSKEKKIKNKIGKKLEILFQHNFAEFFSLFQNEINSFKEIEEKIDLLKKYLEDFYIEESFLTIFIKKIRKINNFKFDIKYSDLNKELLESIKENFSNISKYLNLSKINSFFDREINSYKDLENNLEKYFLTNKINLDDLENLFKEFNLDFKISNLYKLEKEYNEYYKNSQENYVKIEDILVDNKNILTNTNFINFHFSVPKDGEKNKINQSSFLEKLKNIGITTSTNIVKTLESLTDEQKQKFENILEEETNEKDLNINQVLNFLLLTKKYQLVKNGNFISNIELLYKYLKTNYKENLILINGNSFELAENFEEIYYKLSIYFSDFEIFLKIFENLDLEKIIKFYNFFEENNEEIRKTIDLGEIYNKFELYKIIGDYDNLNDFDDNTEKVKAFLVRGLMQKSLDTGEYLNLIENINNILKAECYFEEIINEKLSKNKLEEVLNFSGGFLNESLIKKIIIGEKFDKQDKEEFLQIKFEDIIKKLKEITQIKEEIEPNDFQDDTFILSLEQAGYSIVGTENGNEFKKFFEYFPKNNGDFWKIENFKEGGKLEKIFQHLYIVLKLKEEKNFDLDQIVEFFNYEIQFDIFYSGDKIFDYDNVYYGYFKYGLNKYGSFPIDLNKINSGPVNQENFTDYMGDDEIFLDYNKEGLKTNGIKPFSKAWFLEKPERKKYLKEKNLKIIKEYGVIYSIYLFEGKEIGINKEIEEISKLLGFNIGVKNYFYLRENYIKNNYYSLENEIIKIESILQKINGLNKRKMELIGGLLEEIGISYYYFLKDLGNLSEKININIIINLLKNKIYPTNNILEFIKKGGEIDYLVKTKEEYKKEGGFDISNDLHIDLEYINFRYLIDKATKKGHQIGKSYIEYKQLISGNYEEDIDEEKYYKQAGKESYFSRIFIEETLKNQKMINVFSNFSYGKVLVAGIKEKLENNSKINYKEVRIGSSECHGNLNYLKYDLFAKEDIKKVFQGDSIILDGTENTSFGDSNIGFKNYFFVLNNVLTDILQDKSFIEGYNKEYINEIIKTEEYKKLYLYLKGIITRNKLYLNAKKFEFLYVGNYNKPYLNTGGIEKEKLDIIDKNILNRKSIKIYFTDFVERLGKREGQAYFDDRHITDFKIIPTEKGFNYVDTFFEEKIQKYTLKSEKENFKTEIFISKEKK